jgi:hypothetical protein
MALGRRRTRARDKETAAEDRGGRAGAAVAGRRAVGSGLLLVARLVMLVAFVIVAVIVAAILLKVLGANAGNTIVKDIHDIGKALVGPFKDVFKNKRPKVSIALNWGLAALVYLIVGAIIASILRRLARASHPDRVA